MPKILTFTLLASLFIPSYFIPNYVFASTPETVVTEAINRIKVKRSLEPLQDSIDWQSVYEKVDSGEREVLKVRNSEELKKRFLEDHISGAEKDVELFKEGLSKNKKKLSPEEQSLKEQNLRVIDEELRQQKLKMSKLIEETSYEILGSEINGEEAIVKLRKSYSGQTEEIEIPLKKVSGDLSLIHI